MNIIIDFYKKIKRQEQLKRIIKKLTKKPDTTIDLTPFRNPESVTYLITRFEKATPETEPVIKKIIQELHPGIILLLDEIKQLMITFEKETRIQPYISTYDTIIYENYNLNIKISYLTKETDVGIDTFCNLANINRSSKLYIRSIEYSKKALLICKIIYGDISIPVGEIYGMMAETYIAEKNKQKALKYLEKQFIIYTKSYGEHHPYTKLTQEKIEEMEL